MYKNNESTHGLKDHLKGLFTFWVMLTWEHCFFAEKTMRCCMSGSCLLLHQQAAQQNNLVLFRLSEMFRFSLCYGSVSWRENRGTKHCTFHRKIM